MSQMDVSAEQVALLARFVKKIMADFPDLDGLDPCDLQDIAEEHKILERHIVYSPCGENCNCAQFYSTEEMQAGVPCYRIAEWLDRAAELPLEPTTDGTPTPPTSPHYAVATDDGGTAMIYSTAKKAAGS